MAHTIYKVQRFLAGQSSLVKWFAKTYAWAAIQTLSFIGGFKVTDEVSTMNLMMVAGQWEPGTTKLMRRQVQPGMTVVDIGAHVGYYTRLLARRVGKTGKVYAFEAHPKNFALLQSNTRSYSNVELVSHAVGEQDGSATFYESAVNSGRHSLISWHHLHTHGFSVSKVALDSFLKGKTAKIDFIKIDVEGAELEVLEGGRELFSSPSAPDMLIEYYPKILRTRGLEPEVLPEKLQSFGYTLYEPDDTGARLVPLGNWPTLKDFTASMNNVSNLFATKKPL